MPLGAGGLAEALIVAGGKGLAGNNRADQQMLQATVMHFAPHTSIGTCQSQSCCWRWASQQILLEYSAIKITKESLRVMLDEELGQSAKQRLVDLESEHRALTAKWRAAVDELSLLQRRHRDLEHEHKHTVVAHHEAESALKVAEEVREELESRTAVQEVEFEAKLNAAYCPTRVELQEMLETERANLETLEAGRENASNELVSVRIERTDLEWKVHQLRIALARKARLRRRRRLGTSTRTKVAPVQAAKRLHRGTPTPL